MSLPRSSDVILEVFEGDDWRPYLKIGEAYKGNKIKWKSGKKKKLQF